MKKFFLIAVPFLLILQGSCRSREHFNVLLITIDTLRADHLSAYGYARKTSPAIDEVASEGVLFSQAMAQRGSTWTSVTSILTSMYPHTHGVRENGMELNGSIPTMPGLLKGHGYSTVAFVTNMTTSKHAGFDEVYRFRGAERDQPATKAALAWLNKNHERKFFAWIHYLAPHKPYAPPAPYHRRFVALEDAEIKRLNDRLDQITLNKETIADRELNQIVSLYDAEIAYIDAQISRVLQALEELDLKEKTLLIITADHGEELYDRNHYFYHSCSIYDSVLRIPLIVRFPKQAPENRKIETVVESIDIAPTIFDLLSLPRPSSFEGKSLKGMILNGSSQPVSVAYSEIKDKIYSIRTDRWRYIYNPSSYRPDGEPYRKLEEEQRGYIIANQELYSLDKDASEKRNVIAANSSTAAKLKEQLLKWARKSDRRIHSLEDADKQTLEELKSLGYIQ